MRVSAPLRCGSISNTRTTPRSGCDGLPQFGRHPPSLYMQHLVSLASMLPTCHVKYAFLDASQVWRLTPCCGTYERFWDSPNLDSECLIHFSRKGRMTFTVIYYAFIVLQKNDSGVAQNAVRKGALLTTFTPLISALAVKVDLSLTFPGHFLSGECFWESPNLLSRQTLRKALR